MVRVGHVVVLKNTAAVIAIYFAVLLGAGHGASHELVTIERFRLGVTVIALVDFGAAARALAAGRGESIGRFAAPLRVVGRCRAGHRAIRLQGSRCLGGCGLAMKGVGAGEGQVRRLDRGESGLCRTELLLVRTREVGDVDERKLDGSRAGRHGHRAVFGGQGGGDAVRIVGGSLIGLGRRSG